MDPIHRLVRKEESLGAIREKPLPEGHIGLAQIAPFLDVATDDVIFDYIKNDLQEGLAPARAEDAEAELAQKDELAYGSGRASVIDWSLKDKYTASDVSRYRDSLLLQQQLQGANTQLSTNFIGRQVEDFQKRVARDDTSRRRKLDNRIEWLIMGGVWNAGLTYNDGKIKFTVNYGRPADQHKQAAPGGAWGGADSDPIGDILDMNEKMYEKYGFKMRRAIISEKYANRVWKSKRFLAAVGMPVVGGDPNVPLDPNYLGLAGYTPDGALRIVEQATGVSFTIYDGVYRTRAIGSQNMVNNRFTPEDEVLFLPNEGELGEIDDTDIGFAKTLTAPHPEGNWTSGYYEWEDESKDPWLHVRGTGIKAFPVFPYMEYTYTMKVGA